MSINEHCNSVTKCNKKNRFVFFLLKTKNSIPLTSYLLPLTSFLGRVPPGRAFGTNSVNVPLSLTHNAPPNPMQIRNATLRYGATLKNKTARELSNYITVVPASFPVSFLNMERNQPTRKEV